MDNPQCAAIAIFAFLASGPLLAGAAQAPGGATIRGRIELADPVPATARRPAVSELGMPAPRQIPDRRRSVVYLETAPFGAFERRPQARAAMDQRNEAFAPRLLAITAGTAVDFPNSDRTYHNVFSLSRTRPFDLGRYAAGHSKSVRFDQPGIVRVFCDIHSHMSAFILVFGHSYFAATDEAGRYRIERVPPGTYTVRVWHETLPEAARQVRVTEQDREIELNFTLGRATRASAQ